VKKQIKRLSPHQNGKVFGVLMAVSSLVFLMPMFLLMTFSMPYVEPHGSRVFFPPFMFLIMPLFYLVLGYLFVAVGCLIYNFLVKFIGGIEFELEDSGS
jgi:hypothetical protein